MNGLEVADRDGVNINETVSREQKEEEEEEEGIKDEPIVSTKDLEELAMEADAAGRREPDEENSEEDHEEEAVAEAATEEAEEESEEKDEEEEEQEEEEEEEEVEFKEVAVVLKEAEGKEGGQERGGLVKWLDAVDWGYIVGMAATFKWSSLDVR